MKTDEAFKQLNSNQHNTQNINHTVDSYEQTICKDHKMCTSWSVPHFQHIKECHTDRFYACPCTLPNHVPSPLSAMPVLVCPVQRTSVIVDVTPAG